MADKEDLSPYPLAPPHTFIRSDEEFAMAEELRRKKHKKRITYIAAFVVLQIIVILVFAIVVMRFKTPKFRLRDASFTSFKLGNSTNPSLSFIINAQFNVRNRNWARYKYEDGVVEFAYRGLVLGQAYIDDGRVRARSTKKVRATVVLDSGSLSTTVMSELGRDIGGGILALSCYSELEGKVQVLKVIKKKKIAQMNCTMDVQISTQTIQNLICH